MEYSSGKQTWNWVYIEDLVSGTSLHRQELELSVYCTRSKDITSHIQNITCQRQPYDLKVSPCIYATILDHNQSLLNNTFTSCQINYCSVAQLCPTLCDPMDCSTPDLPILHCLLESAQTCIHWIGDVIQPSHPHGPLLLLPSIFPRIKVFSNESVLLIRWPKYQSFSFSISPSNEYSGLISFRIDQFDLLADTTIILDK